MANFGDRYQLVGRLGEGGMGEVWLAYDELLDNRPVAIKIMRAHMLPSGDDAARFDREMRLAAQMQHPNIVTVFTTGTFNGAPYMVMEYLEGHDLAKAPPGGGIDQVVTIGRETLSALAYAHDRNVIHRDIKPGNLFLCKTGQTKVTDFGIAKAMTGTKLSSSGVLVGTFAYMAPEQWLGEPAAFSNDIWATGCALYEFLAGRPPREHATAGEYAAAAVRRDNIADLRSIARVPDWLGAAVMAMLDPEPRNRPTAAQGMHLLTGAPAGTWATAPVRPAPPAATSPAQVWGMGAAGQGQPTPPPGQFTGDPVRFTGDAGGPGSGPGRKRGRKGRVIASLVGVAVLLIAGLYAGRHAFSGSPAAASGTANPTATAPGTAASSSGSASASASASGSGSAAPVATGTAVLTGVATQVSVDSAPSFTYSVQDVGQGETVELQRTAGQTFEDVQPLSGTSGSVTPPALDAMGQYSYRIAIEDNGAVVSTSPSVTVGAYGSVTLLPFNNGNGTVEVGNRLFNYADNAGTGTYPTYRQNQAWTSSTCRSLTMQFTEADGQQQDPGTVYVEFVQQSTDPAYASAAEGTTKTITVPLDGGPLFINTSSTNGDEVVFNVTGSCYTPSGQPQT